MKKLKKLRKILSFYTSVPQMMIIWCMVSKISSTTHRIFVISGNFLSFYSPNNPENQTFEKRKKSSRGIIILNMSTINEKHIMYDSWDMEHDRRIFFSFWTIFCPFTPLPPINQENQNFEKMEKALEISSFNTSVPNKVIICRCHKELRLP